MFKFTLIMVIIMYAVNSYSITNKLYYMNYTFTNLTNYTVYVSAQELLKEGSNLIKQDGQYNKYLEHLNTYTNINNELDFKCQLTYTIVKLVSDHTFHPNYINRLKIFSDKYPDDKWLKEIQKIDIYYDPNERTGHKIKYSKEPVPGEYPKPTRLFGGSRIILKKLKNYIKEREGL